MNKPLSHLLMSVDDEMLRIWQQALLIAKLPYRDVDNDWLHRYTECVVRLIQEPSNSQAFLQLHTLCSQLRLVEDKEIQDLYVFSSNVLREKIEPLLFSFLEKGKRYAYFLSPNGQLLIETYQ